MEYYVIILKNEEALSLYTDVERSAWYMIEEKECYGMYTVAAFC